MFRCARTAVRDGDQVPGRIVGTAFTWPLQLDASILFSEEVLPAFADPSGAVFYALDSLCMKQGSDPTSGHCACLAATGIHGEFVCHDGLRQRPFSVTLSTMEAHDWVTAAGLYHRV